MLREIPRTRQHPGEPHRRWFHSHEQDLYVWQDDAGEITAFQLCYGKPHRERALYWRQDKSYSHCRVDGGNSFGIGGIVTPLLVADGSFPAEPTLAHFRDLSSELPSEITIFVSEHILSYSTANPNSP